MKGNTEIKKDKISFHPFKQSTISGLGARRVCVSVLLMKRQSETICRLMNQYEGFSFVSESILEQYRARGPIQHYRTKLVVKPNK